MTDPTSELTSILTEEALHDDNGFALLAMTAQQAVLPRHLDEGIYAIQNADGGIEVVETKGYKQQREHDWHRTSPTPPSSSIAASSSATSTPSSTT